MLAVIAFRPEGLKRRRYQLKGKPFSQMQAAFPDWADRLGKVTAGRGVCGRAEPRGRAGGPADGESRSAVGERRDADVRHVGPAGDGGRRFIGRGVQARRTGGLAHEEGYAPTFVFMDDADFDMLQQRAVLCAEDGRPCKTRRL